ncbi:MAG: FMN-binding protein [Eubacterium sp.]|nr:FMN-binding protein [Eubacterium sp.]
MKKHTEFLKKLSILKYVVPVGVVAVAVGANLITYTAPTYTVQAEEAVATEVASTNDITLPEQETLPEENNTNKGDAEDLEDVEEPSTYKDGTYTGSAQGWGGTITVKVTVKNNSIKAIKVVSAAGETPSYFSRAKAVISEILSEQTTNVDTVSGATYSSNGLIKAVRNALAKAAGEEESSDDDDDSSSSNSSSNSDSDKQPASSDDNFDSDSTYKDGTYSGSAEGWGGTITVSVTIKSNKITAIKVTDAPDETPEYLSMAKSVISAMLSAQSTDVDTVSGATYSSSGIIEAVKAALKKALVTESEDSSDASNSSSSSSSSSNQDSTQTTDTSDQDSTDSTSSTYTYHETATIYCDYDTYEQEFEEYDMAFDVVIKNGVITAFNNATSNVPSESSTYYKWATTGNSRYPGMFESILNKGNTDGVDVFSGATITSKAIINMANDALSQYQSQVVNASGNN